MLVSVVLMASLKCGWCCEVFGDSSDSLPFSEFPVLPPEIDDPWTLSESEPLEIPWMEMSQEFDEHVKNMQDSGQLPGIAPGRQWTLFSTSGTYQTAPELFYPLKMSAMFKKDGEPATLYWYLFRKDSSDADWELLRAEKRENLLEKTCPATE